MNVFHLFSGFGPVVNIIVIFYNKVFNETFNLTTNIFSLVLRELHVSVKVVKAN